MRFSISRSASVSRDHSPSFLRSCRSAQTSSFRAPISPLSSQETSRTIWTSCCTDSESVVTRCSRTRTRFRRSEPFSTRTILSGCGADRLIQNEGSLQMGEDGEVSVKAHTIQAAHPKRRQSVVIFQVSERALDGRAAAVELAERLAIPRDAREVAATKPDGQDWLLPLRAT